MANKYKDLTVEQILDKDFYLELLDIQNDLDRESDIALARERAKELKKTGPFDKMLKAAKKEKLEIAIEESKDAPRFISRSTKPVPLVSGLRRKVLLKVKRFFGR